jgi:hypothetical protein
MRIGKRRNARPCTSSQFHKVKFGKDLRYRFKEASQGYFHDYNKARKAFGGKLWMAPNTLIREDVSLGEFRGSGGRDGG